MYTEIVTKEKVYKAKLNFASHKKFDSLNEKGLVTAMQELGENLDTTTLSNLFYVALLFEDSKIKQETSDKIIGDIIEGKGFEEVIKIAVELLSNYFGLDESTQDNTGK